MKKNNLKTIFKIIKLKNENIKKDEIYQNLLIKYKCEKEFAFEEALKFGIASIVGLVWASPILAICIPFLSPMIIKDIFVMVIITTLLVQILIVFNDEELITYKKKLVDYIDKYNNEHNLNNKKEKEKQEKKLNIENKQKVNDVVLDLVSKTIYEIQIMNIGSFDKESIIFALKNLEIEYLKEFENKIDENIQKKYLMKICDIKIATKRLENEVLKINSLKNKLNEVISIEAEKIENKEKQYIKKR